MVAAAALPITPEGAAGLALTAGAYRERAATAPLRAYLRCVWVNELPALKALEVVPDGCMDIIWDGSRLSVAGPDRDLVAVPMTDAVTFVGVRFHPGVAPVYLGVPAVELVNRFAPLTAFWGGRDTAELEERLAAAPSPSTAADILEAAILACAGPILPPDPATRLILAAAQRNSTGLIVPALTAQLGWSERTLRRHCGAAFGYGPKTLQGILRFQRALRLLEGSAPLASVAVAAGYADQPHLTRELHRLSGRAPAALRAELCK
jgi:AraC-like DNA-binding protein